jgi:heme/copper-type cytochrome/quinol oxidase subunit 2
MSAFALVAAAEAVEEHRDLPMPAWAFGVIALGVFFALFALTWSFRSVGNKH